MVNGEIRRKDANRGEEGLDREFEVRRRAMPGDVSARAQRNSDRTVDGVLDEVRELELVPISSGVGKSRTKPDLTSLPQTFLPHDPTLAMLS